jgi:uncharacterized protein (TIGR03435 family)
MIGCLFALISSAFAQPQTPTFEVASIKPVAEPRAQLFSFSSSGPRVRYVAYTVVHLVMEAYGVKNYEVTFAPTVKAPAEGYYNPAFYDIDAKAKGDRALTRAEFRPMLQALLAERFKLTIHRAMKEMPVYVLVVSKDGPKFRRSSPEAVELADIGVKGRNQNIAASKKSMDELAVMIPNTFFVDRPVVNRTGLAGTYDFKLEATPEFRMNRNDPDLQNLSVFSAIQQQLGLKLEPQNSMIEVLVVDHVEKPSVN